MQPHPPEWQFIRVVVVGNDKTLTTWIQVGGELSDDALVGSLKPEGPGKQARVEAHDGEPLLSRPLLGLVSEPLLREAAVLRVGVRRT